MQNPIGHLTCHVYNVARGEIEAILQLSGSMPPIMVGFFFAPSTGFSLGRSPTPKLKFVEYDHLPPELAAFESLLDAQPAPVWDAGSYCTFSLMAEAGVIRRIKTVPGDSSEGNVFETVVGNRFSESRPNRY